MFLNVSSHLKMWSFTLLTAEMFFSHNLERELLTNLLARVCLFEHQTLFNKVQLITVGLVAVGHANLSHVGFADVVALGTVL